MNSNDSFIQTPFQDRDLNAFTDPAAPARQPARFVADFDGTDKLDTVLRSFLLVCILVSVLLCGLRLNGSVTARGALFPAPAATVEVTAAKPAALPATARTL